MDVSELQIIFERCNVTCGGMFFNVADRDQSVNARQLSRRLERPLNKRLTLAAAESKRSASRSLQGLGKMSLKD